MEPNSSERSSRNSRSSRCESVSLGEIGDDELSLIVGGLLRLRPQAAVALGSASKRFASAVSAICGGDGLHLIKPLALKDVLDARLLDRAQANTLQQRRILKSSITHTADQLQRRMSEHAVATALQRRPSAEQLRERAVLTERSERAATLRRQLTAAELSRQLQARPTPDQLEERNILRQHLRSISARLALRIEALKARMAGDAVARVVRERSR